MSGPTDEGTGPGRDMEEALHLYADGLLDRHPKRKAAVERLLAEDGEARRMVEDIRAINEAINEGAPLRADVPARLRQAFGPQARPVLPRIGHTAAALAAAVAVGFFAGHLTGVAKRTAMPEATVAALTGEAADRGSLAADAAMAGVQAARAESKPAELGLGRNLPDFTRAGFVISDVSRRAAGGGKTVVEARYENVASGEMVDLSVIEMPQASTPPQTGKAGGGEAVFWSDGYLAYGLKAAKGSPDLGGLAEMAATPGSWTLTAEGTPGTGALEAAPQAAPLPAAEALTPPAAAPIGPAGAGPMPISGDSRGS